jgi:hypothetical protein
MDDLQRCLLAQIPLIPTNHHRSSDIPTCTTADRSVFVSAKSPSDNDHPLAGNITCTV